MCEQNVLWLPDDHLSGTVWFIDIEIIHTYFRKYHQSGYKHTCVVNGFGFGYDLEIGINSSGIMWMFEEISTSLV